MKTMACCLGLLAVLGTPSAQGANQEIRMLYQPDPAQPYKDVFVNKTPNSGYCNLLPFECTGNNIGSLELPIRFESSRDVSPGVGIPVKVPGNWRQVTVTNTLTQKVETLQVRIVGAGSTYILSDTAFNLVGGVNPPEVPFAHAKLWSGTGWPDAPPPCVSTNTSKVTPETQRFFWKAPAESTCTKVAAYRIPSLSFDSLSFAYELRMPNPLNMTSGLYRGALSYTIGPGGDFGFGPLMQPNDGVLTLDFVLDVQHTLKVDLPPGGNQIALQPEGGWQRWLNSGRAPERLFRDQTFIISASTRFKMYLECGSGTATACGLWNEGTNYGTPLNVSVTLPNGLTDTSGRPVKRQELFPQESRAVIFQPGAYVENKPGILHFEIDKANTERILKADRGNRYASTVVVIWDSEI